MKTSDRIALVVVVVAGLSFVLRLHDRKPARELRLRDQEDAQRTSIVLAQ